MKRKELFAKARGLLMTGVAASVLPAEPARESDPETGPISACPHCREKVLIQSGSQLDPHETRIRGWGQHLQWTRLFCENCGWERVRTRRW